MKIQLIIIIIIVAIPFLLISFFLGLNSTIIRERNKLLIKIQTPVDLVIQKYQLLTNYVIAHSQELNNLLPLLSSLPEPDNIDETNFINLNDNLPLVMNQLDSNLPSHLKKSYLQFQKDYSEINSSLEYSLTLTNESIQNYNKFLHKFPYSIISKLYHYKDIENFKAEFLFKTPFFLFKPLKYLKISQKNSI